MEKHDGFGGAKLPSEKLESNVKYIGDLFENDDTLQIRRIANTSRQGMEFCLIYADGMINNKLMNDDVVRPLMEYRFPQENGDLMGLLQSRVVCSNSVERTPEVEKLVQAVVYGDTVLLADGCADALLLNTKGWTTRASSEPESERVLRGPREGFNESLLVNISMLRRKLRTPDLKLKMMTFGRRTRTRACVCYLDTLVKKPVLKEVERRLGEIDIDGTLDTEYLSELIRDKPYTCVDTIGTTERPDVVAAKLLEGRIAVILDGTPQVMTMPFLFIESFQSDEDYYLSFFFASMGRMLRIAAFYISATLPAAYVAFVTFHPEILPTSLLISITQARQGVPLPTVVEMVFMLLVFEMLRESGARMPGIMGQTLSIVGALVIGQAAVQAKIVSAPIIIVVALAGITGLMNPKIKGFTIIVRFLMLLCATVLGLYGFLFANMALLVHLYDVESFGTPIMGSRAHRAKPDRKDTVVRAPWWKMIRRPANLSDNRIRQKRGGAGQ